MLLMFLKAETLVQTQWADSTTCSTAWAKYWLKHWGMNCFMGRFLCVAGNQKCCAEKSLGFISHFGSRNQLKKGGSSRGGNKDTPHLREGKTGWWKQSRASHDTENHLHNYKRTGSHMLYCPAPLMEWCIEYRESFDGLIWENGFKFMFGLRTARCSTFIRLAVMQERLFSDSVLSIPGGKRCHNYLGVSFN